MFGTNFLQENILSNSMIDDNEHATRDCYRSTGIFYPKVTFLTLYLPFIFLICFIITTK